MGAVAGSLADSIGVYIEGRNHLQFGKKELPGFELKARVIPCKKELPLIVILYHEPRATS
jgi:hypothetical protein